jgi:hypothetical protein
MPSITITPPESPSIPRDGLNFYFDASWQRNRPLNFSSTDQVSSDRSGNYSNYNFSGGIDVDSLGRWIKFDGFADSIQTPINTSGISLTTWCVWLRYDSVISLTTDGILGNRSPGNNNIFGLRYSDINALIYDWATSSSAYINMPNSLITPPYFSPFMLAVSVNSTGATLSFFERRRDYKKTYRWSQSHSAISLTFSFLGLSQYNTTGGFYYSSAVMYKALFWTRNLSDSEINSVYESTKMDVDPSPPRAIYGIIGQSANTKADACAGGKNSSLVSYYAEKDVNDITTGDILYSNASLTTVPSQAHLVTGYRSTNQYININTTTGEIISTGNC